MAETVLVTGSETLTGRKLIEKLLARGSRVIAPVAGRETGTAETGTPNLTVVTWNRSSWFSAKAVVRESVRTHRTIDAAWLLHQVPAGLPAFSDAGSGDIEALIEQSIKSGVALARELLPVLISSSGLLGLVIPHRSGGGGGPLEALCDGAFAGFASALIRDSDTALWAAGFSCSSPDADGFTDMLLSLAGERPAKLKGRWYRHAEGRRPFGGYRLSDNPY